MDSKLLEELMKETDEERAIQEKNQTVNKAIYTDVTSNFVIQSKKFLQDELIMIRKHPRYIDFPNHSHDYIEMNYVFQGSLRQKIGDKEMTLNQGDILLLNQHIEHELYACGKNDIVINFIIDPGFFDYILANLSEGFSQNQMMQFLMNSMFAYSQKGEFLYFPVASSLRVQELMEQILNEMTFGQFLSKSKRKFLMGLLIIELIQTQQQNQQSTEHEEEQKFLQEVFRYIEENYPYANLQDLADIFYQSVYWTSKQIKRLTNQNFKDLLQEKRLLVAKNLILHSDMSMQAIAEAVGYENISYFYRLFKKKYGWTPRSYKKHMAEEAEVTSTKS
ncbi:AraC family transcriptional regulator [Gracilibacillus halophilus YIM-C55.5]|uniref:AraC family transcriptional regulator n=1 Tax=Gracilibacillus halophilus YIM-C55.5 TaxID=1308866 RepID=N4WRI4_9BACI|nr:AraC family transcriptional regulator [Gracilibacillus halophilus]ENH97010.1 AraC family transcriptional regulator [Gracilibacillus halophilus YIM-C55.5]